MTTFSPHARPIDNFSHYEIRRICRLRVRDERDHLGLYYIEGIRFVLQALQRGVPIKTLVVCPSLFPNPFVLKVLREQRKLGTSILEVTPEIMQRISLVSDPQGIGAVVPQQWEALAQLQPAQEMCWLMHDMVRSPGNLGTILRTSEAVGGSGIIVVGDGVDPYEPAAVRSTMGALFSQRLVRTNLREFRRWKQRSQYLLVGTSPTATEDYHTIAYRTPTIVLMGEERKGLTQELSSLCDVMVRIPMVGKADSLNLATASALMLYEVFNQWRSRGGREAEPLQRNQPTSQSTSDRICAT